MTDLAVVLLGIVGVILSLVFKFVPAAKDWLDSQSNKGLTMLAIVVVTAGIYFGLACSPYAGQFNITLACSTDGVFDLLKALFVIASGNQLTYLYTKSS